LTLSASLPVLTIRRCAVTHDEQGEDKAVIAVLKEKDWSRVALARELVRERQRAERAESVLMRLRGALEEACAWGDNFHSCENGWRGETHEPCIQQLEVYRADLMRKALAWRVPLTETEER